MKKQTISPVPAQERTGVYGNSSNPTTVFHSSQQPFVNSYSPQSAMGRNGPKMNEQTHNYTNTKFNLSTQSNPSFVQSSGAPISHPTYMANSNNAPLPSNMIHHPDQTSFFSPSSMPNTIHSFHTFGSTNPQSSVTLQHGQFHNMPQRRSEDGMMVKKTEIMPSVQPQAISSFHPQNTVPPPHYYSSYPQYDHLGNQSFHHPSGNYYHIPHQNYMPTTQGYFVNQEQVMLPTMPLPRHQYNYSHPQPHQQQFVPENIERKATAKESSSIQKKENQSVDSSVVEKEQGNFLDLSNVPVEESIHNDNNKASDSDQSEIFQFSDLNDHRKVKTREQFQKFLIGNYSFELKQVTTFGYFYHDQESNQLRIILSGPICLVYQLGADKDYEIWDSFKLDADVEKNLSSFSQIININDLKKSFEREKRRNDKIFQSSGSPLNFFFYPVCSQPNKSSVKTFCKEAKLPETLSIESCQYDSCVIQFNTYYWRELVDPSNSSYFNSEGFLLPGSIPLQKGFSEELQTEMWKWVSIPNLSFVYFLPQFLSLETSFEKVKINSTKGGKKKFDPILDVDESSFSSKQVFADKKEISDKQLSLEKQSQEITTSKSLVNKSTPKQVKEKSKKKSSFDENSEKQEEESEEEEEKEVEEEFVEKKKFKTSSSKSINKDAPKQTKEKSKKDSSFDENSGKQESSEEEENLAEKKKSKSNSTPKKLQPEKTSSTKNSQKRKYTNIYKDDKEEEEQEREEIDLVSSEDEEYNKGNKNSEKKSTPSHLYSSVQAALNGFMSPKNRQENYLYFLKEADNNKRRKDNQTQICKEVYDDLENCNVIEYGEKYGKEEIANKSLTQKLKDQKASDDLKNLFEEKYLLNERRFLLRLKDGSLLKKKMKNKDHVFVVVAWFVDKSTVESQKKAKKSTQSVVVPYELNYGCEFISQELFDDLKKRKELEEKLRKIAPKTGKDIGIIIANEFGDIIGYDKEKNNFSFNDGMFIPIFSSQTLSNNNNNNNSDKSSKKIIFLPFGKVFPWLLHHPAVTFRKKFKKGQYLAKQKKLQKMESIETISSSDKEKKENEDGVNDTQSEDADNEKTENEEKTEQFLFQNSDFFDVEMQNEDNEMDTNQKEKKIQSNQDGKKVHEKELKKKQEKFQENEKEKKQDKNKNEKEKLQENNTKEKEQEKNISEKDQESNKNRKEKKQEKDINEKEKDQEKIITTKELKEKNDSSSFGLHFPANEGAFSKRQQQQNSSSPSLQNILNSSLPPQGFKEIEHPSYLLFLTTLDLSGNTFELFFLPSDTSDKDEFFHFSSVQNPYIITKDISDASCTDRTPPEIHNLLFSKELKCSNPAAYFSLLNYHLKNKNLMKGFLILDSVKACQDSRFSDISRSERRNNLHRQYNYCLIKSALENEKKKDIVYHHVFIHYDMNKKTFQFPTVVSDENGRIYLPMKIYYKLTSSASIFNAFSEFYDDKKTHFLDQKHYITAEKKIQQFHFNVPEEQKNISFLPRKRNVPEGFEEISNPLYLLLLAFFDLKPNNYELFFVPLQRYPLLLSKDFNQNFFHLNTLSLCSDDVLKFKNPENNKAVVSNLKWKYSQLFDDSVHNQFEFFQHLVENIEKENLDVGSFSFKSAFSSANSIFHDTSSESNEEVFDFDSACFQKKEGIRYFHISIRFSVKENIFYFFSILPGYQQRQTFIQMKICYKLTSQPGDFDPNTISLPSSNNIHPLHQSLFINSNNKPILSSDKNNSNNNSVKQITSTKESPPKKNTSSKKSTLSPTKKTFFSFPIPEGYKEITNPLYLLFLSSLNLNANKIQLFFAPLEKHPSLQTNDFKKNFFHIRDVGFTFKVESKTSRSQWVLSKQKWLHSEIATKEIKNQFEFFQLLKKNIEKEKINQGVLILENATCSEDSVFHDISTITEDERATFETLELNKKKGQVYNCIYIYFNLNNNTFGYATILSDKKRCDIPMKVFYKLVSQPEDFDSTIISPSPISNIHPLEQQFFIDSDNKPLVESPF